MTVWVTRTEPAATATAQRIEALGLAALVDPVLVVERFTPEVDALRFDDLIVTSTNGLAAYCAQQSARHQTVWAVGDATATAAREAGFATVHSAGGDASDLIALLKTSGPKRRYLYLRPETVARDMTEALNGFDVTPALYYRTVPRVPEAALQSLDALSHILMHSPRAAIEVARHVCGRAPVSLRLVFISEAAHSAFVETCQLHTGNLPHLGLMIDIAPTPDEAALLGCLV